MPLGVGGLELLYASPARYRAGVLSAVAYCGPSRAGSQVVSSVYLLILLVLPPSQLFSIGGVWGSLPLFSRFGAGCGRSWSRGLGLAQLRGALGRGTLVLSSWSLCCSLVHGA